jgi:hypothetical protein
MSSNATECNSFPCTATKKARATGNFGDQTGFSVSVRGLGKRCPTDCKTVYPGSIPGVASKSINESAQALRRESRSSRDGFFQHRCLQTSCCVVQLRLQAPLPAPAAGFAVTAAVVGRQEFWQFMACVSQLI